ncbi:MAG: twin-arginine translocase TatA/TatE family subunit [Bacteroidetes bacterium]|nr:twin-arginine translocase TatA/TatE family subunit [Bacteroidota bacterium]
MTSLSILLVFGFPEWGLILLAVVLLFGGRKIPELMRGLGQGIREFNNAKNDVKKHIEDGMREDSKSGKEDK